MPVLETNTPETADSSAAPKENGSILMMIGQIYPLLHQG